MEGAGQLISSLYSRFNNKNIFFSKLVRSSGIFSRSQSVWSLLLSRAWENARGIKSSQSPRSASDSRSDRLDNFGRKKETGEKIVKKWESRKIKNGSKMEIIQKMESAEIRRNPSILLVVAPRVTMGKLSFFYFIFAKTSVNRTWRFR